MMNDLVVGVSGLVGGALLRAIERNGSEVVGAYRHRPMSRMHKLDVWDLDAVRSCLQGV